MTFCKFRLIGSFLLTIFFLVVFLVYFGQMWQASKQIEKSLDNSMIYLAKLASIRNGQYFNNAGLLLKLLSKYPENIFLNEKSCYELLSSIVNEDNSLANLGVANSRGDIICMARSWPQPQTNILYRSYIQEALKTKSLASTGYFFSPATQKPVINLAYPVLDAKKQIKYYLVASVDLLWAHELNKKVPLVKGETYMIIDNQGLLLDLLPERKDIVSGKDLSKVPIVKTVLTASTEGFSHSIGIDNQSGYFAYVPLEGLPDSKKAFVIIGMSESRMKINELKMFSLVIISLVNIGILIAMIISGQKVFLKYWWKKTK